MFVYFICTHDMQTWLAFTGGKYSHVARHLSSHNFIHLTVLKCYIYMVAIAKLNFIRSLYTLEPKLVTFTLYPPRRASLRFACRLLTRLAYQSPASFLLAFAN